MKTKTMTGKNHFSEPNVESRRANVQTILPKGKDVDNRFQSALLLTLLLLIPLVGIAGADEVEPAPTCEILVDWEYDWALDDNGTWQEIVIHRYRTTFDPIFENLSAIVSSLCKSFFISKIISSFFSFFINSLQAIKEDSGVAI